jgi:pimeloyl-ACP methyl ester carboxylesterase
MIRWNRENYAAEAGDGKPLPLDPPATSRLEDVAAPTLLMWGDLDEPGALAGGSEMAARIPAARSIVVAGVAHMVNLERPAEFEAAVLDFLAEVDAA